MAEVVKLLEDLSEKFDLLREDVDSLKERAGKQKKKKGKRSHRRHTRSRSRSTRRSTPSTSERKSRRDSPSRSRSLSPSPRRGTRGHHSDRRSPPSGAATTSRSGEVTQSRSNAALMDRGRSSGLARDWDEVPVDETPDYNELLTWGDPDDEERPTTSSNLVAVSESTELLIKEACTKKLPNSARLQTRNAFPLPQVAATRTPQLDSFIKPEVPQPVKTCDKEWARIQTFVLDALAPLTSLMETDAKGQTITHDQALEAAVTAVQLLGNASAQITHGRRTKVLTHLNKSLLPLLEEDGNFEDVAPSLFGPEFARKSKELVDQVKAIRSTTQKDGKSFFRQGPPKSRGGYNQRPGRGGSQGSGKGNRQFQQSRRAQWTKQ